MNNMSFIDKSMLSPDTFTFISQAHGTTSWLDHCITTTAGESLIANVSVLTPERPMGQICPMFFSCICYMNITKKTILNSRQFYLR